MTNPYVPVTICDDDWQERVDKKTKRLLTRMRELIKRGKHRGLARDMGILLNLYEQNVIIKVRMSPVCKVESKKRTVEEFNKEKEEKIKLFEENISLNKRLIDKVSNDTFCEDLEIKVESPEENEDELLELVSKSKEESMSFDQILEEARAINEKVMVEKANLQKMLDSIPRLVKTSANTEIEKLVETRVEIFRKKVVDICSISEKERKYKDLYQEEIIEGNFMRMMLNIPCKMPEVLNDGFLSLKGIESYQNYVKPVDLLIEGVGYVEVDEEDDEVSDVSTEYFSD